MKKPIRIGALVSGGGTNLQSIIDACENGAIHGKIVFVGADRHDAGGLDRGRKHDIPVFTVDYREVLSQYDENPNPAVGPPDFDLNDIFSKQSLFKDRLDEKAKRFFITRAMAESRLLRHMEKYAFDLLVLAGFMRNLTPYLIDRVNLQPHAPRIMNIHPALLPSFPGVDGYGDTYRYGCKIGGCTVHFVDYGEDSGPIIGQKAFEIEENDTLETIRQKGLAKEWELYPACINLFAQNRLRLVKGPVDPCHKERPPRMVVEITKD